MAVGSRDVRVPVGPDARRWVTVAAERTVLVAVRTVTSTVRALDAVALFASDPRVQVVFAISESSPFVDGVQQLLDRAGARVVAWRQVPRLRLDAVVTATENTDLHGVDAPVLVLPHGVGFHKFVPDSRGSGRRLSGSVRAEDVAGRRVLLAVSHPEQAVQLRQHHPEAPAETVVVADPVYERLRASVWFRDRYRRALGVGDRRLVIIASTWGRQSLLGRWPDAPVRLLAGLPADEYAVAAVLHPNIWAGHGAWQVRSWLTQARDSGLLVIQPETGSWPAALVAADCVVGDHGSMSLYSACLDLPLLLAPFGDEVVPETSLSLLGDLAPRLVPGKPWPGQVMAAIPGHMPGRYRPAVERSFAVAPVARALRSVLYELISLPEPGAAAAQYAWPEPRAEGEPATSYAVYSHRSAPTDVAVRRIPATIDNRTGDGPEEDWLRHLAVTDDEWDVRLVHSATVVVRETPAPTASAAAWVRATLDRLPGARLAAAATADGSIAISRDGAQLEVSMLDVDRCATMLQAACVYTLLRTGTLSSAVVRLRCGTSAIQLRIRPVPLGQG